MSPPDDPGVAPRRVKAAGVRRAHRRRHSDPARRAGATVPWGGGPEEPQVHPRRRREIGPRRSMDSNARPTQRDNGKTLLAMPRLNWGRWRRAAQSHSPQSTMAARHPLWAAEEDSEPQAGTRLGVRGGGEENDRRPMIRPWGRARRSWEHAASTLPHEDPTGPPLLSLGRRGSLSTRAARPRRLLSSFDARSAAAPALSTPRRRCTTLPSQRPDWVSARNQPWE